MIETRRGARAGVAAAGLFALALAPAPSTDTVTPPPIQFTTEEAFAADKVPAYTGRHERAYEYIDGHLPEHLENLRRWVRQESVSAQGRGIQEMAVLVRDDLRRLGFKEAEIVPTAGHPGVWGYYDAGAPRTLVVYLMYDVQPEETGWSVPAFEGALVDNQHGRVLMARGATNQKGPERAFLNALEAVVATEGKLPVNLMVLAEGEEELGSIHYPDLVAKYETRLRTADGVLFPMTSQDAAGEVSLPLGVKGIAMMEFEARGGPAGGPTRAEIHSSLKAVVDAPALRLVQALATLTTPDGNTLKVPGYYDAIRQPSSEEQRLVNGMLRNWTAREELMRKSLGIERFRNGLAGRDLLAQWLFGTTLNVNGIWSGYTGPGNKTILPHVATARVDSRLVPNQTPEEAVALIRKHLDASGFPDVKVRKISGYPPAQTSVEAPLVQAVIGAFNKHGYTPSVPPRLAGSAPYYIFTDRLKLPLVPAGLGHGGGAHAPDEYLVVEPKAGSRVAGLAAMEKFYVDVVHAAANASPRQAR
jgi:acetylornithine deacetylase/succinyl-diaminopimelate desuccinylase-like protein